MNSLLNSLCLCSSAVLTCMGRAGCGQVPKHIPSLHPGSLHICVFFFQALRRCHLKHNIALWQFLSTRKSEQLLRLKRVRYTNFSVLSAVTSSQMKLLKCVYGWLLFLGSFRRHQYSLQSWAQSRDRQAPQHLPCPLKAGNLSAGAPWNDCLEAETCPSCRWIQTHMEVTELSSPNQPTVVINLSFSSLSLKMHVMEMVPLAHDCPAGHKAWPSTLRICS